MDRLQKAALVSRLVQALREAGSWTGETHIQKATYLLQTMMKVPLDYQFVLYRYGPFSFELRDDLTAMRGDELVQLVPQSPPYGPRYTTLDQAQYIQGLYKKTVNSNIDKICFIASSFGDKGVALLERLATAYYVKNKLGEVPQQDYISKLIELKPHITSSEAAQAFLEISQIEEDAVKKLLLN